METTTPSPDDELSLRWLWQAHRLAILAGVALTVLVQAIVAWAASLGPAQWLTYAFGAQLWLMVVLVPCTAHAGRSALAFLARAGAVGDTFALALLFGVLSGRLAIWPAVKVFLLLEVILLLLLGAFALLRFASARLWIAPSLTLLAGAGLVLAAFVYPAQAPGGSQGGGLDLYSAVCDAAWRLPDSVGWQRVLGIFACAAAICWAGAAMSGMPWVTQPRDQARASPP